MARLNLATRCMLGGLMAATVFGCASSPTQQPPTGQPAAGQVTVPVASDLGGGGNPTSPSSGGAIGPVAPAVPIPGLSIGAAPTMLPFVSVIGGEKQLFVYDRTISDNYALVGAGIGVNNPEVFSSGRVVFDRRQGRRSQIFVYDVVAELLVALNDVNGLGSVRRPSMSFDGTAMTFVLEGERRDLPKAMLWLNGVVADLAKVNAQASCEGGVNWIRISCDARWAVFTTMAGRLYVYDLLNPMIHEITQARLYGQISHPAISPDGTQIAFAASDGNVYRYDRVANLVDPMPFLNQAFTNYDVTDPKFVCFDNAHIYTEMLTRGGDILTNHLPDPKCESEDCEEEDGDDRDHGHRPPRTLVRRVTEYNWITETLATLTVLNNVAAEGDQQISDLEDDRDHGGGH